MEQKCILHNKHTDWVLFRELVNDTLDKNVQLKSEDDIFNAVEKFNLTIQNAAWESTPAKMKIDVHTNVPKMVLEKLSEKRNLRKRWQVTRCPLLKTKLNYLTRKLKGYLNHDRNKSINNFLKDLDITPATNYSLWKATKKLKQPKNASPPLRCADGGWARSDIEKATTFARHLTNIFKPHPYEGPEHHIKDVLGSLCTAPSESPKIDKFSIREVSKAIKKLKLNKAPGYDLITGRILIELPEAGLRLLTYIYNAIIRLNYFPPQWKIAQITMLPKPDKRQDDAKSYRPISLLPIPSKLFETLLLTRLMPVIKEKCLIPNHQFGFRHKHGTIEQIHRLVDKITTSFEANEYCAATFLDISQAFDRVWHEGLLYKIKTNLFSGYNILKSYLEERHFIVKCGEQLSNLYPINAGVPQGSVLGPILYLLFTADLPTSEQVTTGTFADDTALLASSSDPKCASQILQISLNDISMWLKKWRIKANEAKSVNVTFTLKTKNTCPPVSLNNIVIPQAEHVRYLGIHLDRRLTWRTHIFNKRKQLGLKMRQFYWMIGQKSQLNLSNKLLLYKAILKPIWTYGIQLWGTASQSNIEILQRFQNKVLRIITNAPWFVQNEVLHHDLDIPTIKQEITNYMRSYKKRITNHPNVLASNLMNEKQTPRRLKRRTPQDFLHLSK